MEIASNVHHIENKSTKMHWMDIFNIFKQKEETMGKKSDVFKCLKCGQIIAVLQEGDGELICCGEKMVNVTPDEGKRLIHQFQEPGTP